MSTSRPPGRRAKADVAECRDVVAEEHRRGAADGHVVAAARRRDGSGRRPARTSRWSRPRRWRGGGRSRASVMTGRRRARSRRRPQRAASLVVWPVPQPTSSTRSRSLIAAAVEQPFVVCGDRPVEVLGVVGPVLALVAIPGAELLDVGRVDRHCVGRGHDDLLLISLWESHFLPKGESCQVLRR